MTTHERFRRGAGALALGVAIFSLAPARAARADEIRVKGDVLHGTVTAITATTVEVALPFGKGNKVVVPVEEIEAITTDAEFVFATGEDGETRGRVIGIRDGAFVVGPAAVPAAAPGAPRANAAAAAAGLPSAAASTVAATVPAADIVLVTSGQALDESFLARAKNTLRYWSGNVDLGVGYSQGTVDSTSFSLVGQARRSKGPFRLLLEGGWWYGTQKKLGETETTLADRLFGAVRAEHDITGRLYGYGNGSLEYNGVQRLSIRGIPEAGLGWKIWKSAVEDSKDYLAATLGGAWVYESYFGFCDGDTVVPGQSRCGTGTFSAPFADDYAAVSFGLEWLYTLPYAGAALDGRLQYLPSVSDFTHDYLLKTDVGLSIPVWKQVAVRFSLSDIYDGTPAPGTTYNYLITNFGLSFYL